MAQPATAEPSPDERLAEAAAAFTSPALGAAVELRPAVPAAEMLDLDGNWAKAALADETLSLAGAAAESAAKQRSLDEVFGPFFMRKKRKKKGDSKCSVPELVEPAASIVEASAPAACTAKAAELAASTAQASDAAPALSEATVETRPAAELAARKAKAAAADAGPTLLQAAAETRPVAEPASLDEHLGPFSMKKSKRGRERAEAEAAARAATASEAAAAEAAAAAKRSPFVVEELPGVDLPDKCLPRTGSYAPTDEDALRDYMPPETRAIWKRKVNRRDGVHFIGRYNDAALERFRQERVQQARRRWVPPRAIEAEVPESWEIRCGATRPPPGEECQQSSSAAEAKGIGRRYTGCVRDVNSAPCKWFIQPEYLLLRLDPATACFLKRRWITEAHLSAEAERRKVSNAKGKSLPKSHSAKLQAGWQAQATRPEGSLSKVPEEAELDVLELPFGSPGVPSGRPSADETTFYGVFLHEFGQR